jgi:hypothetical protein
MNKHRASLLIAIVVGLWPAMVGGRQGSPVGPLSRELRARVQNERFAIVTSIRGLPLGVRSGLETLFAGRGLDIAEPGAAFQGTEASAKSNVPSRRMVAAGCSYEYCIIYYERAGKARTWRVVLFRWTPELTQFEWGGVAPAGLQTIDDIRRAVLSGAVKAPAEAW